MSDHSTPHKPTGPRSSHLHSDPISISFASPQQLAAFTAGHGSLFSNPRMPSQMYGAMPPMNPMNYQGQQVQLQSASSVPQAPAASSESIALKPLPPQAIDLDTFKGFKFITLDPLQIETRDIYDKISGTFRWEMCESQEDRCISHIRDECANKRVFLVSSGGLGAKIVPQIHELPQLYAVYIYCANVKSHQEWANNYSKVRVVCDNDDLYLLPQFAVDVAQSNVDWGNALLKQGTRDKAKEKLQLAYDKLNNYARNHDPAMDMEIKKKLDECK